MDCLWTYLWMDFNVDCKWTCGWMDGLMDNTKSGIPPKCLKLKLYLSFFFGGVHSDGLLMDYTMDCLWTMLWTVFYRILKFLLPANLVERI